MTAQPAGPVRWTLDPVKQRMAAYTLEDVLSLPDDAPRVELRDGVMIAVPSPSIGHQQDPVHIFAYDLVDRSYELVADSAEELVLTAPFEIRLPIADITP